MNIWLLTEERPKISVLKMILSRFCDDYQKEYIETEAVKITPIMADGRFTFTYEVTGFQFEEINQIFIKTVSGDSSFVDYLVFLQEAEPDQDATPIYAIEETKTDDSESRNTGVYQRCSKFVYVNFFYPAVKKIMLYNLQVTQKETPTQTSIFGTRMLRTIGVDIMGKNIDDELMKPFSSVQELIAFKDQMNPPRSATNVPINLVQHEGKITVSGRLIKSESLSHDPNIGALSIIALCLRTLDWNEQIEIILHGLQQHHVGIDNKFIKICNALHISLEGLIMPTGTVNENYWHYESSSEKLASIFVHLIVERYTTAKIIYENHAGSERGYLYDNDGNPIIIHKYQEGKQEEYKLGNKTVIISIPDLIIYDFSRNEIVNIEAKKYSTRMKGIEDIKNYDYIENEVIAPQYKPNKFTRTVVIYGSDITEIQEPEISFLLNENGEIILGLHTPEIIKEAVEKLRAS